MVVAKTVIKSTALQYLSQLVDSDCRLGASPAALLIVPNNLRKL